MAPAEIPIHVMLYEGPGALALDPAHRFELVMSLLEKGVSVSLENFDRPEIPASGPALLVLGRFGEPTPDDHPQMRWREFEPLADPMEAIHSMLGELAPENASAKPRWKPWFPVIDYDRCTNCMQCLSFCLFGVYGVDAEKKLQVQNQDQCKTNCPACSRVCPEAAIMFPKYKGAPINGDEVSDSDLDREKMKIDISALLGGDVYAMLRTRNERAQSRFSRERDSDKALNERQKCLAKLASLANDIPPEVLMSLPSPEEIARKAAQAELKAKAARDPGSL